MSKTRDEEVRDVLETFFIDYREGLLGATCNEALKGALSRLNKIYRVDEEKLKEVIKETTFNKNMDIVTGARKAWLGLSGLNKLARAIAERLMEG